MPPETKVARFAGAARSRRSDYPSNRRDRKPASHPAALDAPASRVHFVRVEIESAQGFTRGRIDQQCGKTQARLERQYQHLARV